MFKKMMPYLLAIVLGIIFGYYLFGGEIHLSNILNKSNYKGFQIGVYTDYEKANKIKEKYSGSILIKDEELYRVYYAVLHDENNIELMEKYLNDNKISYYEKNIEINDLKVIQQMSNLESLMVDANDSLFLELNKKILVSYEVALNENENLA